MNTRHTYLTDDIKYACSSVDALEKEDDLIRLERDEWLELEIPPTSEVLLNNHRSTTTSKSKQRVGWYTNETSCNRLLLQEIDVEERIGESGPIKCAWAFFPVRQNKNREKAQFFPCFLCGSILHVTFLGRESLRIALDQKYDNIFATLHGILLVSETGKLSLLYHHEEPILPVLYRLSPSTTVKSPGTIIWASATLPLVASYVDENFEGRVILWRLSFEHDETFASLHCLKEAQTYGIPDIQMICTDMIQKSFLIINQRAHDSQVLVWPISNLEVQGEYAMNPKFRKVLPLLVGKDHYCVGLMCDSSLCICKPDVTTPMLDLRLISEEGSLILSPSQSKYTPIADRFVDIKEISGCNVTVVLNTGDTQRKHLRVQLCWLPLSSWMRNNVHVSYFPLTSYQHLLDWKSILDYDKSSKNEQIFNAESPYEALQESRDHNHILSQASGGRERFGNNNLGGRFYQEQFLNSLDYQVADFILSEGKEDCGKILKCDQNLGHRSQIISEIGRKLKEFMHVSGSINEVDFDTNDFLECLMKYSLKLEDIDKLPFNIAIPILIMLEICALRADKSNSADSLFLQDRPDLAADTLDLSLEDKFYNPFHSDVLIPVAPGNGSIFKNLQEGVDSMQPDLMAHRFGRDSRVFEARELLSSSRPVSLHSEDSVELGEGSLLHQQQLHLASKRTLALAVGRGAMALCTSDALPTELLDSPNIDLSGRIVERNDAIVTLDLTADAVAVGGGALSANTAWPEFHNGVASALRINPGGKLSRTWIVYNKPEKPSYDHAGFLFGLGLTSQLSCLTVTDLYRYLSHEHDATLVGILLGISTSKRCSMDSTLTKILFLHLPSRHPIGYPDLEISPVVQCAALVGLGQLYQGSSQKSIAETLLQEIERTNDNDGQNQKQVNDITKGYEAYSLCAGFALGLVCLGRGADEDMEIKLHYLLVGGTRSGNISRKSTLSKMNSSSKVCKGEEFIKDMISSGYQTTTITQGQSSGAVAEELAAAQGAAKTVMEGDLINLNATSPAAALALGLMYLKSGNRRIADEFYIPESMFALRMVNPEHICIRIAMKNLIMWDSIEPTPRWLEEQLPELLSSVHKDFKHLHRSDSDAQVVFQGSCFALTGCCLALGLRFAGSHNHQARSLIETCLDTIIERKIQSSRLDANKGISEVLESCITSLIMSLCSVMAGSGDLRVFSLCRALLNRMPKSTNDACAIFYGSYIGASLSIGFLFMSGGSRTFDTSNESVAYLLMSIFPALSTSTADNKAYLQACRHFYVLAARQKITDRVSIRSNKYMNAPLRSSTEITADTLYTRCDFLDPYISHAISRSIEGFAGPEVDMILSRVGLPPSVTGFIHVTGPFTTYRSFSLSSGDMRICLLRQPRLLCHLLKLVDTSKDTKRYKKAVLDLWVTLNNLSKASLVTEALGEGRKSLIALCSKALLPSVSNEK